MAQVQPKCWTLGEGGRHYFPQIQIPDFANIVVKR